MTLLQSWANSLAIFTAKHFKPFAQVTLLNIGRVYRLLWPYLIVGAALMMLATYHFGEEESFLAWPLAIEAIFYTGMILLAAFVIPPFHYSILCLAARPSAERKTMRYFAWYLSSAWRLIIAWFLIIALPASVILPLQAIQAKLIGSVSSVTLPTVMLATFFCIVALFYFDGRKTIRGLLLAIKRTITMLVYNAPLFFIVMLLYGVLATILLRASTLVPPLTYIPWQLLVFNPVLFALLSTIYTTRIHNQPSLYVKETD